MSEYFKNSELVKIHVEWQNKIKEANELGVEPPRMPDTLARAMLALAEKFTSRWNLSGYSYRDLMISDICEVILKYTLNFDQNKSPNLFGYWSRFALNACITRIHKEKHQQEIKKSIIRNMDINSLIENEDEADVTELMEYIKSNSLLDDFDDSYRKPKNDKIIKPKNREVDLGIARFGVEELDE